MRIISPTGPLGALLFAAALALASPAAAAAVVKPSFDAALANAPGKHFTVITVSYGPGEKSGPHRHAGSAFVYARVLSGQIRSQVEGEAARVFSVGESWSEGANAHHLVSENASATEPATLLVVFVADDGAVLTTPDPR